LTLDSRVKHDNVDLVEYPKAVMPTGVPPRPPTGEPEPITFPADFSSYLRTTARDETIMPDKVAAEEMLRDLEDVDIPERFESMDDLIAFLQEHDPEWVDAIDDQKREQNFLAQVNAQIRRLAEESRENVSDDMAE